MTELYYDDSKDLYEGLITEIDDSGQQNQIAHVFPQGREYGRKFAASLRMYEALKELVEIVDDYLKDVAPRDVIDSFTTQPAKQALAKAEG